MTDRIIIAGKMSDCPSYLGITINDRLQLEELIKYDLLVLCPPQFNVTFKLPNWGQRSTKTFDVHLRDCEQTHVVFLTRLLLDSTTEQRLSPTTEMPVEVGDDRELPTLFAAAAGVTFTLILLIFTLFIRLRSPCGSGTRSPAAGNSPRRSRGRRYRVCTYVTVRVVYTVTASFATVLLTLGVLVRPEVDLLSSVKGRLLSAASREDAWADGVDRAAGDEALRQARVARARHRACARYVDQLYAVVVERVARVRSDGRHCVAGGDSGAMGNLRSAVRQYAATTRSAVDVYRHRLSTTVDVLRSVQTRYLAELYDNDWLSFAATVFNGSVSRRRLPPPDNVTDTSSSSRREVDFAAFVGIDVVRETSTWLDQFWHR